MKLTFRGETYVFDPDDMTYPEGVFFQKATGMKVGEWLQGLNSGDFKALAAAAWFAAWQGGRKEMRFSDLIGDPTFKPLKDIEVDLDEDDAVDDGEVPTSEPSESPSEGQ